MLRQTITCDSCEAEIRAGTIEVTVTAPPDGFTFRGVRQLLHFCDRRCLAEHLLKMGRELLRGCTIGKKGA